MNKKIMGMALLLTFAFSNVVMAADISLREAVRFAKKEVPANCHLQNVEPYNGIIGVTFRDFNRFRNYTVFLDAVTGRPTERVMSSTNIVGSTNVLVDKTAITKAVFNRYKKVDRLNIKLEEEGRNNVRYNVKFFNERYIVNALYNPATGALGKEHIIYRW